MLIYRSTESNSPDPRSWDVPDTYIAEVIGCRTTDPSPKGGEVSRQVEICGGDRADINDDALFRTHSLGIQSFVSTTAMLHASLAGDEPSVSSLVVGHP